MIDSLASFLEINRYSPHNGTQPKFLVDMLPEVYGGSTDEMLLRLISRKGMSAAHFQSMLARVEECGSAYLPQVNAFYVREFQMMHTAEDATRFLHQACQGLPHRLNGRSIGEEAEDDATRPNRTIDHFYARVIEHAVAYFGSRVLYPSRPAPAPDDTPISRVSCEKAAQAAVRSGGDAIDSTARDLGHRIGNQIYSAYLAGKVKPANLRRLFLAHLDEPGLARKICAAVISRLRALSRPIARAAHA